MRVAGVRARAEPGDALVHGRRRVRHRPDDGDAGGEVALDRRGRRSRRRSVSTVCSAVIAVPISPSSASMSCGFTAITTSAAPAAASTLLERGVDPVALARARSTRSARRVEATISPGSRQPEESSPEMSASPILPAPRTAIRRSSTAMAASLCRSRARRRRAMPREPSADRRRERARATSRAAGSRRRAPATRRTARGARPSRAPRPSDPQRRRGASRARGRRRCRGRSDRGPRARSRRPTTGRRRARAPSRASTTSVGCVAEPLEVERRGEPVERGRAVLREPEPAELDR